MPKLSDFREEYGRGKLLEKEVLSDPIAQFNLWMNEAIDSQLSEPNAMVLATSAPQGVPSARVVLLKEVTSRGFVFFTNYESRKGREILANRHVALVFDWHEMERQVRIEGIAEKVSASASDEYFDSRPANSRLGAWVSPQSEVIENREILEQKQSFFEEKYSRERVVRPPYWGGFLVVPTAIKFWQGRPNRLHDRLAFRRESTGWNIVRLAP